MCGQRQPAHRIHSLLSFLTRPQFFFLAILTIFSSIRRYAVARCYMVLFGSIWLFTEFFSFFRFFIPLNSVVFNSRCHFRISHFPLLVGSFITISSECVSVFRTTLPYPSDRPSVCPSGYSIRFVCFDSNFTLVRIRLDINYKQWTERLSSHDHTFGLSSFSTAIHISYSYILTVAYKTKQTNNHTHMHIYLIFSISLNKLFE